MRPACAVLTLGCMVGGLSPAAGVECPGDWGVYQATAASAHELAFAGDRGTLTLRYGRTQLAYPFTVTHSNGFSQTHLVITGREAPSSVVAAFNPDFLPYRGEGSAPYLVTPELPAGFYYWERFRARPDAFDLLPDNAWRLIRCSEGGR